MTPLDSIRQGIKTGSWQDVCDGFRQLTGERLAPPSRRPSAEKFVQHLATEINQWQNDDLPQLPDIEAEAAETEEDDEVVEPEPEQTKPVQNQTRAKPALDFSIEHGEGESEPGRKPCKIMPMDTATHINTWKDKGKLTKYQKQEKEKLYANVNEREARPTYTTVEVVCGGCGKKDRVHPSLAPKQVDDEDEAIAYMCQPCINKAVKDN